MDQTSLISQVQEIRLVAFSHYWIPPKQFLSGYWDILKQSEIQLGQLVIYGLVCISRGGIKTSPV